MMKEEIKNKAENRLKRLEGQICGLRKMVQDEKYCVDILQQSSAAKQALSGVEDLILKNHLQTHVVEQMTEGDTQKAVEEIMKVYKTSKKK